MVDFFLLLMLARAGDELQGIKKVSMELADAIKALINKADDDNIPHARTAKLDRDLHYLAPATEGWQRQVQINKLLNMALLYHSFPPSG